MKKSVFGIAKSESQADQAINDLNRAGFDLENISALFQDTQNRLKTTTFEEKKVRGESGGIVHEKHTKASEGGASGALAGGIIGGTIGLLAGLGSLAIPGLGAFIAAGPIMAALGGFAVGGSVGLVVGALIGLGIPEYEAKRYEDRLKKGGVLIAVHCDTSEEIDRAKKILEKDGIEDIATSKEKTSTRK